MFSLFEPRSYHLQYLRIQEDKCTTTTTSVTRGLKGKDSQMCGPGRCPQVYDLNPGYPKKEAQDQRAIVACSETSFPDQSSAQTFPGDLELAKS